MDDRLTDCTINQSADGHVVIIIIMHVYRDVRSALMLLCVAKIGDRDRILCTGLIIMLEWIQYEFLW